MAQEGKHKCALSTVSTSGSLGATVVHGTIYSMIPKLKKLGTTDESISAGFGLDEEVLNSFGFFWFPYSPAFIL